MYWFQRACIQSLYDFEPCECKETVKFIFQNLILERLLKLAQDQECMSLDELLETDESRINALLSALAVRFPDDWKEYDLPVEKTDSSNLAGILCAEDEICFFGVEGSVDVFHLGDGALEKIDHPENEIGMTEPALSSDLYGNIWGYGHSGAVILIEGDSGW